MKSWKAPHLMCWYDPPRSPTAPVDEGPPPEPDMQDVPGYTVHSVDGPIAHVDFGNGILAPVAHEHVQDAEFQGHVRRARDRGSDSAAARRDAEDYARSQGFDSIEQMERVTREREAGALREDNQADAAASPPQERGELPPADPIDEARAQGYGLPPVGGVPARPTYADRDAALYRPSDATPPAPAATVPPAAQAALDRAQQIARTATAPTQGPVPLGAPPRAATRPVGAGGGAVRTDTAVTTQHGVQLPEQIRADIDSAAAGQQTALDREGAAARMAGDREAATRARVASDLERRQLDTRRLEEARQTASRDALKRAQQTVDRAAAMHVDPDRLYGHGATPGRITAAIAVGLGAFGATIGHTQNFAQKIIEDAIDRDVEAQKTDMSNANSAADAQRGLVAQLHSELGDERQADAAAHAAYLEQAAQKVAALGAQSQGEQAQAHAGVLAADLREKAAQYQAEVARLGADRVTVQQSMRSVGGGGRGGAGGVGAARAGELVIPGLRVADQTAASQLARQDLEKVRDGGAAGLQALAALDAMIALRQRTGAEVLDRDAVEQGRALRQQFLHAVAAQEHAGALGDQERASYEARIPDPTDWSVWQAAGQDPVMASLRSMRTGVHRDTNAFLQTRGWALEDRGGQGGGVGSVPGAVRR